MTKEKKKNERNENKCCLSKRLNEDRKATTRNATQLKILERNNKNIRQKSGKKYKNSSYFFSALLLLFGLIVFVLCLRFFFMCSNSKFSCRFFVNFFLLRFFFGVVRNEHQLKRKRKKWLMKANNTHRQREKKIKVRLLCLSNLKQMMNHFDCISFTERKFNLVNHQFSHCVAKFWSNSKLYVRWNVSIQLMQTIWWNQEKKNYSNEINACKCINWIKWRGREKQRSTMVMLSKKREIYAQQSSRIRMCNIRWKIQTFI